MMLDADIVAVSPCKIERWHKSFKGESIRPGMPLSLDEARRLVQGLGALH